MKNNLVSSVFVLHCHYNGLSLIQSLGRRGVEVYAVDSGKNIGTRSKYAKYVHVADPLANEDEFVANLIAAAKNFQCRPLLIPTNDGWAEAVAKNEAVLSEYFYLCNADLGTVNLLLDKEAFGSWAASRGIRIPGIVPATIARLKSESLQYPIAVKANSRRRAGFDSGSSQFSRNADALRFRPCKSSTELISCLNEAEGNNVPVFCQQVVNGQSDAMRTIGVYARDGVIKGILFGKKVRGFPASYGDCIVGQAEPVPGWAKDLAEKICVGLRYTGICEIEVMEDAVTGEMFLIEVNPRSWSWVGVGPLAGVDLAWLAYSDICQGAGVTSLVSSCTDGKPVRYVKVLQDLQNSLFWYRFSGSRAWTLSPKKLLTSYSSYRTIYAEFAWDDPLVSIYSVWAAVRMFISRLRRLWRREAIC